VTGRRSIAGLAAAVAIIAAAAVLALAASRTESFDYGDPFDPLPSPEAQGTGTVVKGAPDPERRLGAFLVFVFNDIQGFWASTLERSGIEYAPATLVVFRGIVGSGCGLASASVGPFYCALDRRVYVDAGFFRQLAVEFRAPGDFAQAYVIAHEVGHHVQNVTGVLPQVQQAMAERVGPPDELSIRMELQADCLAGVWGNAVYRAGELQPGDIEEAVGTALAVGDFEFGSAGHHGTPEERREAWLLGFDNGRPADCGRYVPQ
jgi:predicted metalloprotease